MENKLEKIASLNLRTSGNKIHQTDNRLLKVEIHELLMQFLESQGLEVFTIQNALVVELPNDELGAVVVEFKAIVKNLDYDVVHEVGDYQAHLKVQAERKAQKAKDKAHNIADKEFDKQQAKKLEKGE